MRVCLAAVANTVAQNARTALWLDTCARHLLSPPTLHPLKWQCVGNPDR